MHSDYNRDLARQFMRNAVAVRAGENIWVEYHGPEALPLADACAAEIRAAGATPHPIDTGSEAINQGILALSPDQIADHGARRLDRMKTMQGYIRIEDDDDQARIDMPAAQMTLYKEAMKPSVDHRVNNTRWLVVAAPTVGFARRCDMAFPEFERFYRDVCLADYGRMSKAVAPLRKLMAEGRDVRILSPAQETDVTFSIAGIDAIACTGDRNIPDGECFTAPVRDSINGVIKFGPSKYDGQSFAFIKLHFVNGRAEKAEAESPERTARLNDMLNADPGARYVGEFSLNFNPYIQHPIGNILFDEKIDGGIHMAMGNCYDVAYNGNRSSVHWDMVHIQRADYGGGEIWIDGRLIRKDGLFVLPELEPLNPENLKSTFL